MGKTILIAGASGMIGQEILKLAMEDVRVSSLRSLVRKPSGKTHPKLEEIVCHSFVNFQEHRAAFTAIDAAYFCIGAYTGAVSDALFKEITVDYALAFAKALQQNSPNARLCLLSGAGADRTEKSRTSFARYKGMAENGIANLGMPWHSFRPGYIYPVHPRKEPNAMYRIMRWAYPILRLMGNKYHIPSTQLAKAMFAVGLKGHQLEVLENKDIVHSLDNIKTD
ncbi:MAG: NAD(P)H-binding protein [Flavobacteriaceae bacterium]|nr:NAD(P)H-binding protein [Flavobacteriaceae bacterium]